MSVAEQLAGVRAQIEAATAACGRAAQSVRLIAVSKRQPVNALMEAYDAGVRDFGENMAQELAIKAEALARSGRTPTWHFIGRLQRNKVPLVATYARWVHSIDRPALAAALAQRLDAPRCVLVQVNIGEEAQKGGVAPAAALKLAQLVSEHENLRLKGFMAVPPNAVPPEPYFRRLAELLASLREMCASADELSMGMSHDFATAIACGATSVRVGTAIFGERPTREVRR